MKKLLRGNNGLAMLMVLAFMGLSIPMITAALGLASALSTDSRVKNRIARDQYSDLGATEYALYIIGDGTGIGDLPDLDGNGDPDPFTIPINGEDVPIDIDPIDPGLSQPEEGELRTIKIVSPTTAVPDTLTTYTYTVTIENVGAEPVQLRYIHDGLPPGFSYVTGSTGQSGFDVTTADPEENTYGFEDDDPSDGYQELVWDLRSNDNPANQVWLGSGEFVTLSFDAEANVSTGNYCNQAWAQPEGPQSRTGMTAKVTVGSPADDQCVIGQDVVIESEVVVTPNPDNPDEVRACYTITMTNTTGENLKIWWIRDKMPPGFRYVMGSTSGDLTSNNPWPRNVVNDRQRLNWFFLWPPKPLNDGQTRTLSFCANAPTASGLHWNEIWIFMAEWDDDEYDADEHRYTWPVSVVRVMNRYQVNVNGTPAAEVWELDSDTNVKRWAFD